MKTLKILGSTLATALLLAACGSGTTLSGQTASSGSGTSKATSVVCAASPATIPADGSSSTTITATALDANNNLVTGATVLFSATAGVLVVNQNTEIQKGLANATLTALNTPAGTVIAVSCTVGQASGKTTVNVAAVTVQESLSLSTNAPQIASDGSTTATIQALLQNANNNALPGVAVAFVATSGVLTPVQTAAGMAASPFVPAGTTDMNGIASAALTAGTDPTDRVITVTGHGGTAPAATVPVTVSGTKLSLAGPTNLVLNSNGAYNIVLTNSAGKGVPNRGVTVSSAMSNTLSASSLTTDANGQATVTVTAVHGGTDTLTATALGLTQTAQIAVSTATFSITTPANNTTKVNLGVVQQVTATWLNNAAPVPGQVITFAATRGMLSATTATTDASGNATVTISSTTAGPAVVAAAGIGVTAQVALDFVATNPSQISLQANPAAIQVQGTSTITAIVRDAQNNLVETKTVAFSLTDSTGGQLSVASAITDAQGSASTTYTAGNTTSAANGVIVTANVPGFPASASATLTVGGQSVFLSLGTGNTIEIPSESQYAVQFAVQAVDAQGAALANRQITLRILPVAYFKGGRAWDGMKWAANATAECANEDTDYSGNISSQDPQNYAATCTDLATNLTIASHIKDTNCNGTLDPGNVATVSPSLGTTNATGTLLVLITYPKDHADWVGEQLVATTPVAGTQSTTSATFVLPVAAPDITTQTTGPPGIVSPYGAAKLCSDPR